MPDYFNGDDKGAKGLVRCPHCDRTVNTFHSQIDRCSKLVLHDDANGDKCKGSAMRTKDAHRALSTKGR